MVKTQFLRLLKDKDEALPHQQIIHDLFNFINMYLLLVIELFGGGGVYRVQVQMFLRRQRGSALKGTIVTKEGGKSDNQWNLEVYHASVH